MKYIDASRLKVEIGKLLIPTVHDRNYDEWEQGRDSGFIEAISIIDSLQQEKPDVDLEKEMNLWIYENENIHHGDKLMVGLLKDIARHFYELRQNSK